MRAPARAALATDAELTPAERDRLLLRGAAADRATAYVALADHLLASIWTRSLVWWLLFGIAGLLSLLLVVAITYTVAVGIGTWGNNIPVAWAFAITDFVWWIGIGHAGTFISAFLLLLNQKWRASINRVAEAMTLFALVQAGLFPVLHLGRPWFAYWLIPYPATMGVWPNFKSSLPWDVAAVSTYFTVSLLFWYLGLVPDLASARDRVKGRARRMVYGVFALGWRGSGFEWQRYRVAYTILGGLATPLVISVHSVVSLDFSIAQLPGWHSTIFPPYFVVGAIYSGFAMVLLLLLPLRHAFGLQDVITEKHLENIAKLTLTTGLMLAYSYVMESFMAWYSGDLYERYMYLFARPLGPYAVVYWIMTLLNVATPQIFWWRRCRRSPVILFLASLGILAGMWLERFEIIVSSLNRDFLSSSWHFYFPTWVDLSLLAGSIGFFGLLFLLFVRYVPPVAISEVQELRYTLAHRSSEEAEHA
ncbi:MAG TPA: NrfD/PsrC family molybdoenzyme membrane anchor subunit [Gemmatimonadaceae bacterium]|nr:NrfD/PsrC family molybdoenzyme membrane anchor subunit [Gemmatimonadaceae bacterium]